MDCRLRRGKKMRGLKTLFTDASTVVKRDAVRVNTDCSFKSKLSVEFNSRMYRTKASDSRGKREGRTAPSHHRAVAG